MKKLLLHVCCGPCSTECIERLKDKYNITLLFSNSNIYPKEEYEKRKQELIKVAKHNNMNIIEDDYKHKEWLSFIKGLEKEKEGNKRCEKCFEFSFKTVLKYLKNYDNFTTTLTISPYKDSLKIFKIGKNISNKFLEENFKKQEGYKKSIEHSKRLNLYRQDYCGCEFSKRN